MVLTTGSAASELLSCCELSQPQALTAAPLSAFRHCRPISKALSAVVPTWPLIKTARNPKFPELAQDW
jgi:hypothetical protein